MMVAMIVSSRMVVRMLRATFAIHPAGVAVDVVLFFPDWHAMLYFVDDEAAGFEGFIAMTCADANPHCNIANGQ